VHLLDGTAPVDEEVVKAGPLKHRPELDKEWVAGDVTQRIEDQIQSSQTKKLIVSLGLLVTLLVVAPPVVLVIVLLRHLVAVAV
jgi:hypothetical protein